MVTLNAVEFLACDLKVPGGARVSWTQFLDALRAWSSVSVPVSGDDPDTALLETWAVQGPDGPALGVSVLRQLGMWDRATAQASYVQASFVEHHPWDDRILAQACWFDLSDPGAAKDFCSAVRCLVKGYDLSSSPVLFEQVEVGDA